MNGLHGYNPFVVQRREPQQQQQQPFNLSGVSGLIEQFGGGGAGAGGGLPSGGGGAAQAGGGASQAGGGIGEAISGAGPWAALAALIVGNEWYASSRGYRDEDPKEHARDAFSGEVFFQDMEQRWLPKLGVEEGSDANKWLSLLSSPTLGLSADPEKTFKRFEDLL